MRLTLLTESFDKKRLFKWIVGHSWMTPFGTIGDTAIPKWVFVANSFEDPGIRDYASMGMDTNDEYDETYLLEFDNNIVDALTTEPIETYEYDFSTEHPIGTQGIYTENNNEARILVPSKIINMWKLNDPFGNPSLVSRDGTSTNYQI